MLVGITLYTRIVQYILYNMHITAYYGTPYLFLNTAQHIHEYIYYGYYGINNAYVFIQWSYSN